MSWRVRNLFRAIRVAHAARFVPLDVHYDALGRPASWNPRQNEGYRRYEAAMMVIWSWPRVYKILRFVKWI